MANAADRGYGADHGRERRRFARLVAGGSVACARCGGIILPGEPWDLDHDDEDRSVYLGPSHSLCNRRAAGRLGARRKRARNRRVWSRQWLDDVAEATVDVIDNPRWL